VCAVVARSALGRSISIGGGIVRKFSARISIAVTAALILAAATSSASANHLMFTHNNIRITWNPVRFVGGTITVTCNLTLEGSFHSATIAKVVETLIGHITRGAIEGCSGGTVTLLMETLPWHLRYNGFTGALPNIRLLIVHGIGFSYRIQPTGSVPCLLKTTATEPAGFEQVVGASGEINNTRWDSREIALDGLLCAWAGTAHLEGNGRTTVLNSGTTITVTLI